MKRSGVAVRPEDREFRAYDCSQPANLSTLVAKPRAECVIAEPQVDDREAVYRVLQRAQNMQIILRRCKARRSRTAFHCSWAHNGGHMRWHWSQNPITPEWKFYEEYAITPHECRVLWKENRFADPYHGSRFYPVKVPGRSYVVTNPAGTFGWEKDDGHCQRGSVFLKEGPEHWGQNYTRLSYEVQKYENAHVTDYYELFVEEVPAQRTADGTITLENELLVLPCKLPAKECRSKHHGTFLWDDPTEEERCRYFSALEEELVGREITDAKGRIYFYHEQHMLRVEKRASFTRCKGRLYHTDFDNLFLTPDIYHESFERPIPLSEVSVLTYANQQDSFLYKEIVDMVKRELVNLRANQCKLEKDRQRGEYARQAAELQAVLDGETAMVGDNRFVTAAGEVWYSYTCRPVVAIADPDEGCYSAMPVKLLPHDLEVYLSNALDPEDRKGNTSELAITQEESVRFFLEPKTHRLITVAAPQECAPPLVPLYHNRHDRWIAWNGPALFYTPPPKAIESVAWDVNQSAVTTDKNFDFDEGGIYSAATVRKMERFKQNTRTMQVFTATLANQMQQKQRQSCCGTVYAHDVFQDIPGGNMLNRLSFFDWFWDLLEKYGRLCSIIICTGLLIRFMTWITGVLFRLFAAPVTGSIFGHVFSAFFPSARDFLRDNWLVGAARAHAEAKAEEYEGVGGGLPPPEEYKGMRREILRRQQEKSLSSATNKDEATAELLSSPRQ